MNQNDHFNQPNDYSRLYGNSNANQNYTSPPVPPPSYQTAYQQPVSDYKNYYRSSQPVVTAPPKEKKPKQPFSPISLLLVAGVIFLFLGGVIFLTKTWGMLSDTVRALSLLSASLIAFGMNVLAERIFRLRKTGLAFYILGCIFLPLALGGIGIFQLLGEWFSFKGDGAALLWTVIFLCITGSTFLGQKNYKNTVLVWMSLSGTAGSWTSLCFFITAQLFREIPAARFSLLGVFITAYAVGAAVVYERYLKLHKDSYITRAIPSSLYIINLMTAIFMFVIAPHARIAAGILSVVTAVLFCNYRFIEKNIHTGILGSVVCLMTGLYQVKYLFPASPGTDPTEAQVIVFCFMFFVSSVILMSLQQMPKLRTEFTKIYSYAGMLLAIPVCMYAGGLNLSEWVSANGHLTSLLYALLILGIIFFSKTEKNAFSEDTRFFVIHAALLFLIIQQSMIEESDLLTAGLVIAALILLIQAVIRKKIWMLTLAIITSGSAFITNLEHSRLLFFWLCAAGMLGGLIYANRTWRFLLERSCAWGFLAFLTPAVQSTLVLITDDSTIAWTMTLAVCGLLYLLETFVFSKDLRPNATRPYLELESLLLSLVAVGSYFMNYNASRGIAFLLCLLLLVFAGGFLQKNINAISIPQLIMAFAVVVSMLEEENSSVFKFTVYLVLLILYAAMGRFLLPNGFYYHDENKIQIDWALLAGILPVFGAASTIDWYPSILICLFMAVYSLLYIGRVENKFIPTLMASAFSCLTVLFHNINDPFDLFLGLRESNMETPQVLLYVLPIHMFILSLLWILPEKYKKDVHNARFAMYCVTMLILLCVSLNFNVAADAILLMVFSFLILAGSFTVRKLRWFTLGFSILFLTTIRLTWRFWTSLHWGIYLFLAGIILIGIASYTEYKNRYYAEHPDEPKKKLDFFKAWTW